MAKPTKSCSFFTLVATLFAVFLLCAFWPNSANKFQGEATVSKGLECARDAPPVGLDLSHDPPEATFYDDPKLSYRLGKPMRNWDEKRKRWLLLHPSFSSGAHHRVLLLTGSQPSPCKNPTGDHLLLRLFKNKADYCRIHGYDIFYNNVMLEPGMFSFWAKLPLVRAAMVAHPETEWIWWVDSDALFTDMEFKLPLGKYENHNLVLNGWTREIYVKKSWTGLNAGVFLIRNCQWSMDLMDVWASMGPSSPDYKRWGQVQRSLLKDKLFPESDDQAALIYLMLKEREKWAAKIYLESGFHFQGYWVEVVGTFRNLSDAYLEVERGEGRLRRRHAEKVSEGYGKLREQYLDKAGIGFEKGSVSLPFITHFTGCQPCSGDYNENYSGKNCWEGIQKALTFADNQVLRNFGFVHPDVLDPSSVAPLSFNYPA